MKSLIKVTIIATLVACVAAMLLSSCTKELETPTANTETLYFRLEGVREDGSSVYSPIQPAKVN